MNKSIIAITLAAAFGTAQANTDIVATAQAADLVTTVQSPAIPEPLGTTSTLPSLEIVKHTPAIPLSYHVTHAAARQWLNTGIAADLVGTNGAIMYAYGQSRPTVTCAPLHICTITLLEGEHVTNISIGDSVRWLVQPTTAGKQPVVIVKPTDVGLVTNLVITTDQGRVYYLTLASKKADYIPLVGFYDPQKLVIDMQQEAAQAAAADTAKADAQKQAVVAPLGSVDPAALDFDFACKGDDDLKPVRVFAGNGHTYLQMPAGMKDTDAPAVFNTSNGSTELVNSRLVHDYYLVDGLPAKFKLVLGVGSDARSVECTHGKPGSVLTGLFKSRR